MSKVFDDPDGRGPYQLMLCRGQRYALEVMLSPEDWEWAIEQGNWMVTHGARLEHRDGPMTSGYACRSVKGGLLWLHKVVLHRAGEVPPSERHTIGDHLNGNRLDDRRGNLRWATYQMNARNLFGFAYKQMELDFG